VQLANGYLYLDAAADVAHALLGYDSPEPVDADAAAVSAMLDGFSAGYQCVALAAGVDLALRAAEALAGEDTLTVDAQLGEPPARSRMLIVVENLSLGRTGSWLASPHWSRKPDLIVIGNALAAGDAFGAVLAPASADRCYPPTIAGNLGKQVLVRVAGVIAAVESTHLIADAVRVGAYFEERVRSLAATEDAILHADIGPLSARIAFRSTSALRMKRKLCERGVLVGLYDTDQIIIAPPLIMRPAEVDVITGAIRGALRDVPTWRPSACCPACRMIAAD